MDRIWRDIAGRLWRVSVARAVWQTTARDEPLYLVTFRLGGDRYQAACRPVQHAGLLADTELEELLRTALDRRKL